MKAKAFRIGFLALALPFLTAGNADAANDDVFITLGTQGGPVPNAARSQPANALLVGDNSYLIDAGDGAAGQLAKAGVPLRTLKAVFISHLHFDHTGGLAAILGLRYQTNAPGVLTIYGPPGTKTLVDGLVASMAPAAEAGYGIPGAARVDPAATVKTVEIRDGAKIELGDFVLTAAENTHYSFPKGGELDQRFDSLSFRFDLAERAIVYSGDTGPSENLAKLAGGADLLVTEMIDAPATIDLVRKANPDMLPQMFEDMAHHLSTHHLTTVQIGEMAAEAKVRKVVVTHYVTSQTESPERYRDEIHALYDGDVVIANDLDRF